jgi:hypothetical protein
VQDDGSKADFFEESRDRLACCFVVAVNDEDLTAWNGLSDGESRGRVRGGRFVVGDVVFERRDRPLKEFDRTFFALGKVFSCFDGVVGVVIRFWSAPERRRDTHGMRSLVEVGSVLVKIEPRRSVAEGGSKGVGDFGLERDDFGDVVALGDGLRVEGVKRADTTLQPLDAPADLIGREDGRLWWRAVGRTAWWHGSPCSGLYL